MYRKPAPGTIPLHIKRRLPPGTQLLGEDEHYYYFVHPGANPQLGGFFDSLGNMFTRMVKITPKSFTPGNIYKGFINTSIATMSGGLSLALPSKLQSQIRQVANYAVPIVAGGVLAAVAGPSIMATLGPKISAAAGILGKDALKIGGQLFSFLGKMSPAQQAKVAEQITPQNIATMEQSAQLPPELQQMFQAALGASLPRESTGAASLYNPEAQAAVAAQAQPAQASMIGGVDVSTLALIGLPVLFFALSSRK